MAQRQKKPVVEWTNTDETQFYEILNYWTNRNMSTSYAEKLSEAVWERTQFLLNNPNATVKTRFANTRKAALGHYSIIYKIVGSGILITAFWDNRQDPKKLYQILKKEQT